MYAVVAVTVIITLQAISHSDKCTHKLLSR